MKPKAYEMKINDENGFISYTFINLYDNLKGNRISTEFTIEPKRN